MLLCDASFNPHSDYTESWAGLGLLAFGPHLTPTLFCFVMQEGWQPPLVTGSWRGLGIQKPWGGKGCRLEGSHAAQPLSLSWVDLLCASTSHEPGKLGFSSHLVAPPQVPIPFLPPLFSPVKDDDASCCDSVLDRSIIWSGQ